MREIKIGANYHHFKGFRCKVLAVGKDAETLKEKVVYSHIDNEDEIWIRDKEEFLSLVDRNKYPEVTQKYRFELEEED